MVCPSAVRICHPRPGQPDTLPLLPAHTKRGNSCPHTILSAGEAPSCPDDPSDPDREPETREGGSAASVSTGLPGCRQVLGEALGLGSES